MNREVKNEYLDAAGQCPCCGSDDTDAIRSYDLPDGRRRMVEYQCQEGDCGVEFTEAFDIVIVLAGKIVDHTLHQTETQYRAGPAAEDSLELLDIAQRLKNDLQEAHEDEILHHHYGDDLAAQPCSYCRDIADAGKVIDGICGVEQDAEAASNEKDSDKEG
jgi:hypothetical protein